MLTYYLRSFGCFNFPASLFCDAPDAMPKRGKSQRQKRRDARRKNGKRK